MKKTLLTLMGIITLMIGTSNVQAGSSINTNTGSIYLGNSVTVSVTVTDAAAWEVHIGVSGAASASNCGELNFADSSSNAKNTSKTYTATCTPTKTGNINFILTGNATNEAGITTNISGSKVVSVINRPVVQKPVQRPNTNGTVTPKSSVNYLSSLEIDGQVLTPNFNKETVDYSVELESGTTSINIKATTEHNKASITGAGVKNVTEGINNFEIVVTAENGSKRIYKIKANVKEKDPIVVNIDDKNYTVIRKREQLISASAFYSESSVNINGEEIPAYFGEVTGYTLVGLKDSEGNINLFIYDEENSSYSIYQEFNFSRVVFYPIEPDDELIPNGFSKYSITINEAEIPCYKKNKNDNFVLIYGVNIENNHEDFYVYNALDNTIQRYDDSIFDSYKEEIVVLRSIIAGLACIIAIILVVSALQGSINKDNKKSKVVSFSKQKNNCEEKNKKSVDNIDKENVKEAKLLEKELKRREKEEAKRKKYKKSLDDTNIIDITNINIKRK